MHFIATSPLLLYIIWCSAVINAINSSADQSKNSGDNISDISPEEKPMHSTLGSDDILVFYTSLSTANILDSPRYSIPTSSSSGSSNANSAQKIARLTLNPIKRPDGSAISYYGYHDLEGRPVDISGISMLHGRKDASCKFVYSNGEDGGRLQVYRQDTLLAQEGMTMKGPLMEVHSITCKAPKEANGGV